MSIHSKPAHTLPAPPSVPQLLLYILLLGWLPAAAVVVGIVTLFLPSTWPALWSRLAAWGLLAGLVLPPVAGFVGLVHRRPWSNLRAFGLALGAAAAYAALAVAIRAVTAPAGEMRSLPLVSEPVLRLVLLLPAVWLIAAAGLPWAGLSGRLVPAILGVARPRVAGWFAGLAVAAVLTVGWPLTGALGDSWVSLLLAVYTLALVLPEEMMFRGAVVGVLTRAFHHRRGLAVLVAILTYVAFTPTQLVPRNDWGKLVLLVAAIPYAMLLTELRLLTGNIWAGVAVAWAYRAFPLLFTDPRVELPLLTEPWQTAARLWMVLAAGGLALLLLAVRVWLAPRWRLLPWQKGAAALLAAAACWGVWLGLWVNFGRPGFYNDGFLIIMAEQADLQDAAGIGDLPARRAFVRERLVDTARRTQAPVIEALQAAGLPYRRFYLINMIQVKGHHRRMAEFAGLPGVARVALNPNVRPYPARVKLGYGPSPDEGRGVEWNIAQVRADRVWEMGITGRGIVVAGQDTGYDWQHPALKRAYRGYRGPGNVNHNYNWHDAWENTPEPFDDDQHGTHTMGTILGNDGQDNRIGMAPDAQWIGCRNMRRGIGNPASYTECMEFFLAPYPLNGDPFTGGDVLQAPHIINNSWGCPDFEGCDDPILEPATAALRAAGIMMVVSAGNDGPACETVSEPPARYGNVFSVGATGRGGLITGFSSRGPVPGSPQAGLKPDVTAPGANIRSSLPGGGYGTADGTSMAGPHVAGLVALLWSANPALAGRIEATEEIIRRSARPTPVTAACSPAAAAEPEIPLAGELEALAQGNACTCGGVSGTPNNVYGWGEIDALEAVRLALAYNSR